MKYSLKPSLDPAESLQIGNDVYMPYLNSLLYLWSNLFQYASLVHNAYFDT